ncbi:hypothetical protein [Clostridium sp.]|uniref:hypothetical protein n=1 Tax=Clostridium sp. TaxID=1506 RepID=UPI002843D1CB|nr:hypothetical protein [Clostridium sp.]MDR3595076.1 hypothetical protein [Clostridium sp.]
MNQKFHEKDWFLWVCLIFFAPVGIFLLWKNKRYSKNATIILTVVFAIWFVGALAQGGKNKPVEQTTASTQQEVKQADTPAKKEAPKKEWKPKEVAELGKPYYCYDKSKTTSDGLPLVLNMINVELKDNTITLISGAPPFEDIEDSKEKYMKIKVIDQEGNSSEIKDAKLTKSDYQYNGENYTDVTKIVVDVADANNANWIEIDPYSIDTNSKNPLIYEIK